MKVKSCFFKNLDPYRAGMKIGEELSKIDPEVIFLFPTIHYHGSPELTEAIYDIVDNKDLVLIGSTGDGFYEKDEVSNVGVSALGINTGAQVRWHVHYVEGITESPFDGVKKCIKHINNACGGKDPVFYFFSSDFRTDAIELTKAVNTFALAPIFGGLAGDDDNFKDCFLYANKKVLRNSFVILACEGTINFDIGIAHKSQPVGIPGIVTKKKDFYIQNINNLPAMNFIQQQIGKQLDVADIGQLSIRTMGRDGKEKGILRTVFLSDKKKNDKSVRLFGGIENGEHIQLCMINPEDIFEDIKALGHKSNQLRFDPLAALIISCTGRKHLLHTMINYEAEEIMKRCKSLKSLAGFSSFGEFGPLKDNEKYTKTKFQNMTYILLLIGE